MVDEILLEMLLPYLRWGGLVLIVVGVLIAPMPGRGPRLFTRRDPWRGFRHGARRAVMDRAGHRCEAAAFIVLGRCRAPATDADHVYPWSKGGPTILSNGQALCRAHNRSKSAITPPWWYVLGLERRRRSYVVDSAARRVCSRMSAEDRAVRR